VVGQANLGFGRRRSEQTQFLGERGGSKKERKKSREQVHALNHAKGGRGEKGKGMSRTTLYFRRGRNESQRQHRKIKMRGTASGSEGGTLYLNCGRRAPQRNSPTATSLKKVRSTRYSRKTN